VWFCQSVCGLLTEFWRFLKRFSFCYQQITIILSVPQNLVFCSHFVMFVVQSRARSTADIWSTVLLWFYRACVYWLKCFDLKSTSDVRILKFCRSLLCRPIVLQFVDRAALRSWSFDRPQLHYITMFSGIQQITLLHLTAHMPYCLPYLSSFQFYILTLLRMHVIVAYLYVCKSASNILRLQEFFSDLVEL